jgi:hypothetical protein
MRHVGRAPPSSVPIGYRPDWLKLYTLLAAKGQAPANGKMCCSAQLLAYNVDFMSLSFSLREPACQTGSFSIAYQNASEEFA